MATYRFGWHLDTGGTADGAGRWTRRGHPHPRPRADSRHDHTGRT